VRLAKKHGLALRQSYVRVGKLALIKAPALRPRQTVQARAGKMLKKLKTILGRVRRDIARKIKGHGHLIDVFTRPLSITARVLRQKQRQRGRKVYALHALEVECIGKGKAHKPYEFGVKVSVATPLSHPKGGQFVTHVSSAAGESLTTDTRSLPSSPPWRTSPARPSPEPSPMQDTKATMRRDRSRSIHRTEARRHA